jgi:hydroxymethylpyrimidine pyrophosphatase-like HAD family hydrolase
MLEELSNTLADCPLDYLSTNNGQELFMNHDRRSTADFFRSLPAADPAWARHVASRGWDIRAVRNEVGRALHDKGFRPLKTQMPSNFRHWQVLVGTEQGALLPPDQAEFQLVGSLDNGQSEALMAHMNRWFTRHNIAAVGQHYAPFDSDVRIHIFQPADVSKRALLEHLVTHRYPSVRSTITIGDNLNDNHLAPETIGHATNYPILMGTRHPHRVELAQHPRIIMADEARLPDALRYHTQGR